MKKYKTLREVVDFFAANDIITHKWLSKFFTERGVQFLIREECIEEIQEPEFTKDDMVDFLNYFVVNDKHVPKHTEEGCRSWLKDWIRFKKRNEN
jgi:hypothetical protein